MRAADGPGRRLPGDGARDLHTGQEEDPELLRKRPGELVRPERSAGEIAGMRSVLAVLRDRHDVEAVTPGFANVHRGPDLAVGEDRVQVEVRGEHLESRRARH